MPNKLSAKNKIVILCVIWATLSMSMFFIFFKILDNKNKAALEGMAKDREDLVMLQSESESYKKAQADLDQIKKEEIQPEDFFSKDTTLVKEIQILEGLNNKYGTQVTFSGISGLVGPSSGSTALMEVPYSITIVGSLANGVDLIENFENLSFITKAHGISFTSSGDGKVYINLMSNFYIRK